MKEKTIQKEEEILANRASGESDPSVKDTKPKTLKTVNKTTITSVDGPKAVVNTAKAAELVRGGPSGSGAGSSVAAVLAATPGSYSGNQITGDISGTPVVGQADRKDSRTGRKLDSTLKRMNYITSEQVSVGMKKSAPLSASADKVQGSKGNYRNEHVRTQKTNGFVPGQMDYDREVSNIRTGSIYPIFGQDINDPSVLPVQSFNPATTEETRPFETYDTGKRGNWLPRSMQVKFNSDGRVIKYAFVMDDITPTVTDINVSNAAAVNGLIDSNVAELDRQAMDVKAGDETSSKYSPIPRSIQEPTATVGIARDFEGMAGAEIFMARRKLAHALSYQINKAGKDGQRVKGPMAEMLHIINPNSTAFTSSVSELDASNASIFNVDAYIAGSPALMIALYDSTGKYVTKGDMLLMPRSFKMHLDTANSNSNVFKVPKKFVDAVKSLEVFSTMDGSYDPYKPVCISDYAGLAHPFDWNKFIDPIAVSVKPYVYRYLNSTNNGYVTKMTPFFLEGILDYLNSMGNKFYKETLKDGSAQEISIPIVHSLSHITLWDLIVCAATPYIAKARINSMIDFIDYEEDFGNPFSQLIDMKSLDVTGSPNFSFTSIDEALNVGSMSVRSRIRWRYPELMWYVAEEMSACHVVLPWYFNESQFVEGLAGKLELSSDGHCMSMPSVRSGLTLDSLDELYSLTERQIRLTLDRMVVPPLYGEIVYDDCHVYKYGSDTDGIPCVKYPTSDLTLGKLLSTPRELGWVIPAPIGVFYPVFIDNTHSKILASTDTLEDTGAGCFIMQSWHADGGVADAILSEASVNVVRGLSLYQVWDEIASQRLTSDYAVLVKKNFLPSASLMFDKDHSAISGSAVFTPFVTNNGDAVNARMAVVSLQRYFWFRLQRLPFAINPFEAVITPKDAGYDDSSTFDPFDLLYFFGLAGFIASDYNEDLYNRLKEINLSGMYFSDDPYLKDSFMSLS